ncbi:MAG: amidohydrolase [Alphaproteobacteria bacterium]|nr:amidohydrolase [Alphaproteobacteria bacterium]
MTAATNRIDVHHHLVPAFYIEAQKAAGMKGTAYTSFPDWTAEKAIALMDRMRIAIAIQSFTAPGIWFGDRAETVRLARTCNDYLAALVARHPKRFGAFAMLPLPDVDAALAELARALDTLKLDGVVHLTHVDGRYVGHADYWPVYEELNRRGAVLFIHPTYPPRSEERDWMVPRAFIDYPLETTRTISYMLFTGMLAKLPDIRMILSHAGGAMPFLAHRLSLFDGVTSFAERYPEGAKHYLRRLYYDVALSSDPNALRALQALTDPTHILYGSDYPYVADRIVEAESGRLDAYAGFDATARPLMERQNALALFPRLAKLAP